VRVLQHQSEAYKVDRAPVPNLPVARQYLQLGLSLSSIIHFTGFDNWFSDYRTHAQVLVILSDSDISKDVSLQTAIGEPLRIVPYSSYKLSNRRIDKTGPSLGALIWDDYHSTSKNADGEIH